jgi:hypothetical protein
LETVKLTNKPDRKQQKNPRNREKNLKLKKVSTLLHGSDSWIKNYGSIKRIQQGK